MEIGIIFGLLSALFFSLNNIFSKKSINKLTVWSSLLLIYFSIFFTLSFISLFLGNFDHPVSMTLLIEIILIGFFGLLGVWALLSSFDKISVSETLAIANIYPFITLILLFLFFNKEISLIEIILIFLVFLGILLVLKKNEKLVFNKNLIFPLLTGISWGIYYFLLGDLSNSNIAKINLIFYAETSILFFLIIFILFNKNIKFPKKTKFINYLPGMISGLFSGLGTLFFAFSASKINSAISSSIVSSQIVFSSIFAYFIFKEKLNLIQIIGIAIVFLSIALFQIL